MRWSIVVPVKLLAEAKSRLASFAGPLRSSLALAFAEDTVASALSCPRVSRVVVVTDDPVAAPALTSLGAVVVADKPDSGLNPALVHGAAEAVRLARGVGGVAALSADLPALRPSELARALDAASACPRAFVADAAGVGTTLYAAADGAAFEPLFGRGSRRRHLSAGAVELTLPDIATIRRDVDTPADLRVALALGAGPRTAAIASPLLARRP